METENKKYKLLFTNLYLTDYYDCLPRTRLSEEFGIKGNKISLLFVFNEHTCSVTDILEVGYDSKKEYNTGNGSAKPPCLQKFSEDIVKLFYSKEHSDVVLKCGERSFPAHRTILSARSVVFSAMFRNEMSERNSGVVDIADLDPTVLEQFLLYIYGKTDQLSMDIATDLYEAADKYAVHSLKEKCSSFILDNLSKDVVCKVLLLADKFGDFELLGGATTFAADSEGFLKTEEWKKFAREYPGLAVNVYHKFHE